MRTYRHHYYSYRGRRKHPSSVIGHIGRGLVLPIAIVIVTAFTATGIFVFIPAALVTEGGTLLTALGFSALRLFIAYVLAIMVGIPLGLFAEVNPHLESFLLPLYDVLESLPVLAFFPVIILFFLHSGFLEGAASFIIFFSIVWTVAFSTIGGMRMIPEEVKSAGKVFELSWFGRLMQITLPALFPPLLTASILSIADGWNLIIVAEALHAYAPSDTSAHDLFGIGSILVSASTSGNTALLISAMLLLVVFIAIVNFVLWQPLLAFAERFKFE